MRTLKYKATYQAISTTVDDTVTVQARDLNSGARKAMGLALHQLPESWEFVSLEFAGEA